MSFFLAAAADGAGGRDATSGFVCGLLASLLDEASGLLFWATSARHCSLNLWSSASASGTVLEGFMADCDMS